MLFAGIDHDFAIVLEQINAPLAGHRAHRCTSDGEMSLHILFARDSLALVLVSGDNFYAVSCVASSVSTDVAESIRTSANDVSHVWPESTVEIGEAMASRRASASPCATA
jgi:hypothetical protein